MPHRPLFNLRPLPTNMSSRRIWKVLPNLRSPVPMYQTQIGVAHETLADGVDAVKLVHCLQPSQIPICGVIVSHHLSDVIEAM
jgi:hypothetical protein